MKSCEILVNESCIFFDGIEWITLWFIVKKLITGDENGVHGKWHMGWFLLWKRVLRWLRVLKFLRFLECVDWHYHQTALHTNDRSVGHDSRWFMLLLKWRCDEIASGYGSSNGLAVSVNTVGDQNIPIQKTLGHHSQGLLYWCFLCHREFYLHCTIP